MIEAQRQKCEGGNMQSIPFMLMAFLLNDANHSFGSCVNLKQFKCWDLYEGEKRQTDIIDLSHDKDSALL